MLRNMLLVTLAIGSAACAPVTADEPLFAGDPVQPAEGLWVWADPDCRLPTSPDIRTWPQCAQSLRVEAGLVTWTRALARPDAGLRASAPFAASAGDPLIVRLGGPENGPGGLPLYHFVALQTVQRNAAGRVVAADGAILTCQSDPVTGIRSNADGACSAQTVAGLRALAAEQLGLSLTPPARLRWIAPLS